MTLTKMRSNILIALVAAVLFCAAWNGGEDSRKTKWEYSNKAIGTGTEDRPQFQEMLAQAGAEGWELIAVDREPGGVLHLYFKRAR